MNYDYSLFSLKTRNVTIFFITCFIKRPCVYFMKVCKVFFRENKINEKEKEKEKENKLILLLMIILSSL
jgi:hypothetical protein